MKWIVCGFLFLAVTILYLHRQALSIVAPHLASERGWTETDYANMVVGYQLAYATGVFAAGWLIDRVGTRFGFPLFVVLWSLMTAAHGWAVSVASFIGVRFGLGLLQAGCFPCAIKATAEWFPKEERALATGIFNTGSMVGPIIAPLAIVALFSHAGWTATCLVLAVLGVVWGAAWLLLFRRPVTATEPSDGVPGFPTADTPWPLGQILRCRATWGFFIGKLLSDPVWWFFLFWLPKFLHDKHGLKLTELGLPLVTIYTITIFGSVGAGWLTKWLTTRGIAVRRARILAMLLSALLPVPVLAAAGTPHVWSAVVLIGLATAGHSGWMANLFSVVSDHFPKQAVATVTGIGTMGGALGGIAIASVAGWVLDSTGSYWPLFLFAASSYLVAWLILRLLLPSHNIPST